MGTAAARVAADISSKDGGIGSTAAKAAALGLAAARSAAEYGVRTETAWGGGG